MQVTIVGGGLAGSECAWQLAERGVQVRLLEQKPIKRTPAQSGDGFAELVCSNSFRGAALANAVGLLKEEMRRAGSLIIASGDLTSVPAGGAMAVDRERFSEEVTRRLRAHPNIRIEAGEVTRIPEEAPVVLATGPLTGDALAADLAACLGEGQLAYYDAIAPIVSADSIDWSKVFRASRYDKGGDDAYVNCPLTKDEYTAFVEAIRGAQKVEAHSFEDVRYFEGCLPVEVLAERGERTLAFGPMKPVGLTDPKTGRWPYAVVQLRAEDQAQTAYNLVGFQSRMTWGEQQRVFRMIPGLENAEFVRLGTVHRNTFVNAPRVLGEGFELKARPGVHLAGQVSGVEGYVESAACGLVLGATLAHSLAGTPVPMPPPTTALGALVGYLHTEREDFQPSNVVWSMFPPLTDVANPKKIGKRERHGMLADRALQDFAAWCDAVGGAELRARHPRPPAAPTVDATTAP
ncbi:MAG: methylenetetrahydrofolate--tRNA-(uracil(54)-C(5))-methyltransferase (FADH(2)-oxidizing) TrmFO [Polyangiales bacterium]